MNLIGLDVVREKRRKLKFTVLRKDELERWNWREVERLVTLGPCGVVNQHPTHLETVLVHGEWTREQVRQVLHHDNFSIKIVQGWDNPDLPFRPNI